MLKLLPLALAAWVVAFLNVAPPAAQETHVRPAHTDVAFKTSDTCLACHNGLRTPAGEDVSIGADWRGSIMANSARDPYWQASVRRETLDHPKAGREIEDECATCHMPMSRTQAAAMGERGRVFDHLAVAATAASQDLLARDGVSCTTCHQISAERLGTPESFSGAFAITPPQADGSRPLFGPFEVDKGRTRVMQSATGFRPSLAPHIRQSELCATCHTLFTTALGPNGEPLGRFPEQTPYQEWRRSSFPAEQASCQTCHMPEVPEAAPITSVLGQPRAGLSRHTFRGANAFMLRMLKRYRSELGVTASDAELEAAEASTLQQLQSATATVAIDRATVANGRLEVDVSVRNLAGHKLPTGYPARRAWLHLVVRDADGRPVFSSGAVSAAGAIDGNDADAGPARYEPHHSEIRRPEDVQIYESILADRNGGVTTGLLRAVRYLKDNRLLPRGFDKRTVEPDIAVQGDAASDSDFLGGSDSVRYSVAVPDGSSSFTVDVALLFQTIGFRWAQNLRPYEAVETKRFVGYYESMAPTATETLAKATTSVRR